MNRIKKIESIRETIINGDVTVGSWIQIPHASIAEIMGQAGYDWVAVDMEHGAIGHHQLPDLFRALELGNTLPLARLKEGNATSCKQALDAGAGGVIVPMVESAEQLVNIRGACCWPPAGIRGVGFSRANLFGKQFDTYTQEAQSPLLVAMIEHIRAVNNLDAILNVDGLDAILIGPYDLSASIGLTAQFEHPDFLDLIHKIKTKAIAHKIASGIHVVHSSTKDLALRVEEGYRFIAYSIDSVFLVDGCEKPELNEIKG